MGEVPMVSIDQALNGLRSEKVKERTNGLTNLKYILSQNRRSSKLEKLRDSHYHSILEAVFRVVKHEVSTYATSSRSGVKERLSACAGVVRTTVEVGLRRLRLKTVKALIDHVMQTITTSNSGYCEPLVTDYFKALRIAFEYPPHAEHLSKEDWHDVASFCNETLRDLLPAQSESAISLSNGHSATELIRTSLSRSVTPSIAVGKRDKTNQDSNLTSYSTVIARLKDSAEDVIVCLRQLISVANAPILDNAYKILLTLIDLLQAKVGFGHVQLLESINSIMVRIMTDDISLALQTLRTMLPIIQGLWPTKSSLLKDQMLLFLLYGEVFFSRLVSTPEVGDSVSDLTILFESLRRDYCRRQERDQLQLDDLEFSDDYLYIQRSSSIKVFGLRSGAFKAEKPWFLLHICGSIIVTESFDPDTFQKSNEDIDLKNPTKRRRLTKPLDEILQLTKSSTTADRFFAFQVLAFVFDSVNMDKETIEVCLQSLLLALSDDNGCIASWAMLALSSVATQALRCSPSFQGFWLQAWRLAARYVTSLATCRAACHLMVVLLSLGVIKYADIADLVDGMIVSIDLNGPADCTDSACILWSILVLLRAKENPGLALETSDRVLRWLCTRWRPTNASRRNYTMNLTQKHATDKIFRLISTSLGISFPKTYLHPYFRYGSLLQARLRCTSNEKLVQYLFLNDRISNVDSAETSLSLIQTLPISLPRQRLRILLDIIMDHLLAESGEFLSIEFANTSGFTNTTEMISAACSLSIISYAILDHPAVLDSGKSKDLRNILDKLKYKLIQSVQVQHKNHAFLDGIYDSFSVFMGPLADLVSVKEQISNGVISMARGLGPEFWKSVNSLETQNDSDAEDAMEVDDEFGSQRSHVKQNTLADISHNEIAAANDTKAFCASLAAKICFLSVMASQKDNDDASGIQQFLLYLFSLRPYEFLACRPFIREWLGSQIPFSNDNACILLEYLGNKIIKHYEFERCEVSMCVCLEIMAGLTEMWTTTENAEVSEVGGELYDWFVDVALSHGLLSSEVHISISSMLQRVIKINPEYAKTRSGMIPSARTSLFQVLQEGNIKVKFQVGRNISEIFGLFVLSEHENILEDIISNLPSAIDWQEGIAIRLFVLGHLASCWHTLLRRCVYAIFEIPRHVPGSGAHARYCLTLVSRRLKLKDSKELFKLFASQIVYTWLETQSIKTMPYAIFGYGSLSDLLQDVQDEVVGQIIMRGRDDEARQMADEWDKPFSQLVESSFSKAAAYSIARDVAVPPTRDKQAPGAENRLRKILGKEKHNSYMIAQFPTILSLFYKTLDAVDDVEKAFQKRPSFESNYMCYKNITSDCVSGIPVPVNQQPSFKARYLIEEIEFLCRRTGYKLETMWTPELYTYVFRDLFDSIRTELGSLHACSVLRRIRVLISMAGSIALEMYPIEMALHCLRPYITNSQCASDAMGLARYLIEYGHTYLTEVPYFVAGFAVSTFTSMRSFLMSSQESTTQESQFKATMSKAHTFHTWLASYLDDYTSPLITNELGHSFRALVKASRNIRNRGNPRKGTYESDLLFEILEDERSGRSILNQPAQDLILGLLCHTFDIPLSFRDDIFGSDEQATLYAPTIWKICRRNSHGADYLLWIGRVLGRAYATNGIVSPEMILETHLQATQDVALDTTGTLERGSRSLILKLLHDVLSTDDPKEVGVAESILRSVVSKKDIIEFSLEWEQVLPSALMRSILWTQYQCPPPPVFFVTRDIRESAALNYKMPASIWIQDLCISLVNAATNDPLLSELPRILSRTKKHAEQMFPYILHIVLRQELEGHQSTRRAISDICSHFFRNCDESKIPHVTILIKAILYLRQQPLPLESTKEDRSGWLELDYRLAADAAAQCSMFKSALLFLDISYSEAAKASRRSSGVRFEEPTTLLLHIYRNIDEQDAFYGVQQPSTLSSMMNRLEYENAGYKSLSFRGAHYDSLIRLTKCPVEKDEQKMIRILDNLDLNGLSQSVLSKMVNTGPCLMESMLGTARKLEQWDVSVPKSSPSNTATIFEVFQGINNAVEFQDLVSTINTGILNSLKPLISGTITGSAIPATLSTLSVLVEIDEMLSSKNGEELQEIWSRFETRDQWKESASFETVSNIVSCRETLLSSLSKSKTLQGFLKVSQRDARALESRALLASSRISRYHGALQNSLTAVTYLSQLIGHCEEVGLSIRTAVQVESANVLWDQGEMTASIRMLQDLQYSFDENSHLNHVGKPQLLAKLGHQISEARLQKPDEIIEQYLAPAINELKDATGGSEAGQVFHKFARFCDKQLQNADSLEDFQRIKRLRARKEAEVRDLEKMIKSSGSQTKEKDNLKSHRAKAKQWFELDNREYQRLFESRQVLLRQSLENYLLCLRACDKFDNDALRFSALWLENWDNEIANAAVSRHVTQVGSRKFAALMNQWCSRLLDITDNFQNILFALVLRICIDHPYHGMYQIFVGSKTKGGKDETALARYAAANKIVNQLKAHRKAQATWLAVHNTNIGFVRFATEKIDDGKVKAGAKILLRKSITGQRLEQDVANQKIPPPTMRIALRTDCNYKDVPTIARFQPDFTLASGISMPKIVTALGTDGQKYKQLFKGGNDDLRQDSIMEQVFEQVSNLLHTQRATRQRNLGIRTYKVLPLTATSGIIEFVQNTIPLHDYLMPAHQQHFPKDLKPSLCRKHIADAQPNTVDYRIKTFRQVTDQFHPVLRYFFMERFENPDDWFEKRLAYTRSTATISILGHILGLGDRHGSNILLDEKTGEVVHIDLGIAFEQGRVLPVPEVVPFRLTRDLVDGMGITRTEGVFRRCCEFTLDALRKESDSIMTILDVLRYDPLYSWSLSPLRLKKMQESQTGAPGVENAVGLEEGGPAGRSKEEPGEADRALTVVAKKLSKSLSVTAMVNELIQIATDEKNLALLFAGWAAYA